MAYYRWIFIKIKWNKQTFARIFLGFLNDAVYYAMFRLKISGFLRKFCQIFHCWFPDYCRKEFITGERT